MVNWHARRLHSLHSTRSKAQNQQGKNPTPIPIPRSNKNFPLSSSPTAMDANSMDIRALHDSVSCRRISSVYAAQ
jgi:hypothetical protein